MAETKPEMVPTAGTQQNTPQETPETKTFKYGNKEYLIDDLLVLHRDLEQNFYDFARTQGHYDDAALADLRKSIASRIDAVRNGQTFSADGRLDTDEVNNVTIPVGDRKFRRQLRREDRNPREIRQDNTEAAIYYLNKLMSKMSAHNDTSKEEWDLTKHGLEAYLSGHGYNAQEIFERYDTQNPNTPEAPRSFTQRLELLRAQLPKYKEWFTSKNFDLTKDNNDWNDKFLSELDALINNFDERSKDINGLTATLRFLGAGDAYATAFTSDRWKLDQPASEAQQAARAAADQKKAEEEAKQKAAYFKEFEDHAYNSRRTTAPVYYDSTSLTFDGNFIDAYGDLNAAQQANYGTYLGRDGEKWNNAFISFATAARNGTAYNDKNAGVLLQGTFINQPHLFTDLGDGTYLINDTVTSDGQGTVYNPTGKYTQTVFLGDYAASNDAVKKIYERLASEYIKAKHGVTYDHRSYVFSNAQGGNLIPMHQTGSTVAFSWQSAEDAARDRAKQNNVSTEVQKGRERYIDSDNKSVDNPDAGFKGPEIARLVSIGADITSMFLTPIAGTITGIGSSALNFAADIADDGFQWEDVKNLGINVGFDLLGAIPIFGDAVGTGTKITRKLIKFAPRVMGVLAGYQGVKNFDGMMESWRKMTSSDEDAKMTVQDWRNIAQSITLITGGVRATRNKIAQNEMKKAARVDGVVGVNVYNKRTQQIERVLVDGDTAKNIRNAKSAKDVEAELSKLDDFKDKFGDAGDLEVATSMGGLQKPWEKVTENGKTTRQLRSIFSDGKAQVTDVYDFSRVSGPFGTSAKWLSTKGTPEVINNQRGKMSSEAFEAKQKELLDQAGVEAQVGKVKEAAAARKKYLEDLQGRITTAEGELATVKQRAGGDDFAAKQADAEAVLAGLPSKQAINDAQAVVTARQKFIDNANQRRQALSDSRQKQLADMEAGLNAQLDTMNKSLNRLKSRKRTLEAKQKAGALGKKEAAELRNLPSRIKEVQKSIKTTRSKIVTNAANIRSIHGKKRAQLKSDIKTAKGEIATAAPVAAQSKDMASAIAQRDLAKSGIDLQNRLDALRRRQASHDPATAHTQAYRDLENMLSNLRTNNPTIGSRAVSWDMQDILKRYGLSSADAFKEGGPINRNKINKFLNYAKR